MAFFSVVNCPHCHSLDWTGGKSKLHLQISVCVYVLLTADVFWEHKNPPAYNKMVFVFKLLLPSRQSDQECIPSAETLISQSCGSKSVAAKAGCLAFWLRTVLYPGIWAPDTLECGCCLPVTSKVGFQIVQV